MKDLSDVMVCAGDELLNRLGWELHLLFETQGLDHGFQLLIRRFAESEIKKKNV